jgi:hypothetical protein
MRTAHGPAGRPGHVDRQHHHHDPGAVRSQPVVLDLGAGTGALVVRTDPILSGLEVELSPAGRDGERQHRQVLERALGGETAHVLVYDGLAAGDYTLWLDGVALARGVAVRSGEVAELDWREVRPARAPAGIEPLASARRTSGVPHPTDQREEP